MIVQRINLEGISDKLCIREGTSGKDHVLLQFYENDEPAIISKESQISVDVQITNTGMSTIYCTKQEGVDGWYMTIPERLTRYVRNMVAIAKVFDETTGDLRTGYFTFCVTKKEES